MQCVPVTSSEVGESNWEETVGDWRATAEVEVVGVQGNLGKKKRHGFGLCERIAMTYVFSKTQLISGPVGFPQDPAFDRLESTPLNPDYRGGSPMRCTPHLDLAQVCL